MKAAKKKTTPESPVLSGVLSKKEAARRIAGGMRHVHSAVLGERDALARLTLEHVQKGTVPIYPWEKQNEIQEIELSRSAERHDVTNQIIQHPSIAACRDTRERVELVLEELLTNALYHAYRLPDGGEKYPRKSPVELAPQERVKLRYAISKEGVYLSISDRGGNLDFEDIAAAFERCYGAEAPQIQTKDGGAGLGLYMVFEAASHYKGVCCPGKWSEIAIWISDRRASRESDADPFSFNYFNMKE